MCTKALSMDCDWHLEKKKTPRPVGLRPNKSRAHW